MKLPLAILFSSLTLSHAATWYAAPTGTDGGSGTLANPISLARAVGNGMLSSPAGPGDTIYLRDGTYAGGLTTDLNGSAGNPITLRPYQSERPIISTSTAATVLLNVYGQDITIQGIEFQNTAANRSITRGAALMVFAPRTKIIGCIIHDTGIGIGLWDDATPSEINGCLIYNCGESGSGHDSLYHGIYSHAQPGGHRIRGNVILNVSGFGIQCYADTSGAYALADFLIEGNVAFGAGALSNPMVEGYNYFIGGDSVVVTNLVFMRNRGYHASGTSDNAVFGFDGNENANSVIASNYWSGGSFSVNQWSNLTFTANSAINPATFMHYNPSAHVVSATWNNNTYESEFGFPFQLSGVGKTWVQWKADTGFDAASSMATSPLTSTNVFVRVNDYVPGTGYAVVYNYGLKDNVNVDLSGVLTPGKVYTVRNAANYFGPVVKTGTYGGGSVSLPMTNLTVATPVGLSAPAATGPAFNAFIVSQSSAAQLIRVTNLTIRAQTPPSGHDYYVATTGNDSADGSLLSPWLTIAKAATVAAAGDRVHVASGLYPARTTLSTSGTAGSPITFTGPYATPGATRTATNYGFEISANYVTLQYFRCSNNTVALSGIQHVTGSGIAAHGHDLILRSNDCVMGAAEGIYVAGTAPASYNVDVIGNRCWSNSWTGMYLCLGRGVGNTSKVLGNEVWGTMMRSPQADYDKGDADGIQLWGRYLTITSNYVHGLNYDGSYTGNHVDGIQTWNDTYGGAGVADSTFNANILWLLENFSGWEIEVSSNLTFINNLTIAYDCMGFRGDNPKLWNNTFVCKYNSRLYGYGLTDPSGLTYNGSTATSFGSFSNNIVVSDTALADYNLASFLLGASACTKGSNLVYRAGATLPSEYSAYGLKDQDPKLVDPFASSFNLGNYFTASDGAGVDAGAPVPVSTDIRGVARPQGSAWDIGAYEYSP